MYTQRAHLSRLSKRYPGKRAFITGSGSGLGLAFATQLAQDNWTVAITDIDEERLHSAAEIVRSAGGVPTPYVFDVSDYDKFREAVNDFEQKQGGIDIGINNAGIGCGGFLHEVPIETFRRVIDVNLMGVAHGCHLFVPIMKRQQSGHILNVASAAAFIAAPRMSAYNASKAAVVALSETLRGELSEDSVFVSILMPTYVRTNIGIDAVGSVDDKHCAKILVEQAELNAEDVALETLLKMGMGELYIVLPAYARRLWRFKRWLPDSFWRFISNEVKRRSSILLETLPAEHPSSLS